MLRKSHDSTYGMEMIHFRKKETVTHDELLKGVLKLETELERMEGVVFHCLVRNYSGVYAHILFVQQEKDLEAVHQLLNKSEEESSLFHLTDELSVQRQFHKIHKTDFKVPDFFSCIECGTFSLKPHKEWNQLVEISDHLEKEYLCRFENTQAHFLGTLAEGRGSEITFGTTLGQTKNICMGYFDTYWGRELLGMMDEKDLQLDFWYLIA
ncbi:hypothetical protein [Paenimyroides ceti]